MDKVIIMCNSQVVLDSLIESGLTITAAAKLRRHFGNDAITCQSAGSVTA